MGARLLLLYVLCQTVITESLGGVTLPFSDLVGKVTPIKPKPLCPSAVSSSSLLCDSKDGLPELFSSAPGAREYSSPLVFMSSSRALPVPKIDSLSITDVKMPERLREKFLLPKLRNPTVITESLGGVTLPLSDVVGKVTPIKPKPLSPSAGSSSSPLCDSKDILPKLFSSAAETREFSSPLVFMSSSRALPVPKIDSLSIADVKMPERLREKFLLPKLRNPVTNSKPDTPDVSLPCNYSYKSSSTKPPNALPTYSSWDMYSSSLNKISPLSKIKSLPIVPEKPLKSDDTDVLCSAPKINHVLAQPSIIPLSKSRTLDSPLTLEARKPSFTEQFDSNNFSPLTSFSSPYLLYYKSMYLPGVRTPSEMLPLNFRPVSYKAADNIELPSQPGSPNLLNLKTLISDSSLSSVPVRNGPYLSTYMNPIIPAEIPKPINIIQLPNTPLNVPVSPIFSAQNAEAKNSGSASVVFESRIKQPEFLSTPVLKDCTDPIMLRSSMPYLLTDKIPNFKLKPCTPLNIKPSEFGPPSNFLNSPPTYLAPISPSSEIVDVLSNRLSSYDCSKNTNKPDMFPIMGACVETKEKLNNNGPNCNCQICVDSNDVPGLERINLFSPFAPKLASNQHPLFTEECVTSPLQYSPPIIPLIPIPTISSGSAAYSPIAYSPSQTHCISYISQCPPCSIAQSTAKMVSSINGLVSNIAQSILSSYKSYIDSATPNVSQRPTYRIQSNPYENQEFIPKQTLPVLPLSQGNIVITEPVLPICINPPAIETSTISSSDASCKSSAFDVSSNQPLLISATQPTVTITPPTSVITLSSPQLCPSYLPSPSLPSYPTTESPFCMEAPVFKVSSSKKDSDIEKLIELVLLAEILNNDESFDWDDLDMLLAFLSVS